ncbi:hypothetical protein [Nonomuraea sediminis]|uniref:hypothetical protein n=1 Tax=Nonomuraea sediminis TaxID=2835864 RepID=UPI001BDD0FF5|nr:hypothetical protein [Nonomuraea sediminis]
MPVPMINVRNKKTGEVTEMAEEAFPHHAGAFERIDDAPPAVEQPDTSKRAAKSPTTGKEQ